MGVKLTAALGGSVELVPTNTASNYTLTLPATTGAIGISGPTFSAYRATDQSVTTGILTKIQLSSEVFDIASCFNNTGSTVGDIPAYAFLPNVAGYYQVSFNVASTATSGTYIGNYIYVNGIPYVRAFSATYSTAGSSSQTAIVYLNGTTDYVEFYGQVNGTSPSILGGTEAYRTLASAALVRAA